MKCGLYPMETEIMDLWDKGLSVTQIAQQVGCKETMVENKIHLFDVSADDLVTPRRRMEQSNEKFMYNLRRTRKMWPTWYVPPKNPQLNKAARIIHAVAEWFGMDPADITGRARRARYVSARWVAIQLMCEVKTADGHRRFSYPQIGAFLNNMDHSTVLNARDHFFDRARPFLRPGAGISRNAGSLRGATCLDTSPRKALVRWATSTTASARPQGARNCRCYSVLARSTRWCMNLLSIS